MLELADALGHGTHGAIHAPGTGLEKNHGTKAKNCGGQHHSIKPKGKLGDSGRHKGGVNPMPRQFENPKKSDGFLKGCSCENQIGRIEH